ncbi:prepilin-type N-terminal cleavage/methylation domain-containing protein [Brockia lithotrophica]|uniref:Prepilin-type N-terminal cleavage/methylation domain-containing protein n=1 Tax=Brockia lithotrophica TaxID=933949 RepID=A0A660L4J6_9BACL|nr:prepilin-type N-terminal cleavage/methylation domain-containing protein [Brockia lithotrophica]RKQ88961.1 prepilin-type N-terminal cleavage/methylation domain-containing protein [Brockia lithotrophica]
MTTRRTAPAERDAGFSLTEMLLAAGLFALLAAFLLGAWREIDRAEERLKAREECLEAYREFLARWPFVIACGEHDCQDEGEARAYFVRTFEETARAVQSSARLGEAPQLESLKLVELEAADRSPESSDAFAAARHVYRFVVAFGKDCEAELYSAVLVRAAAEGWHTRAECAKPADAERGSGGR